MFVALHLIGVPAHLNDASLETDVATMVVPILKSNQSTVYKAEI